MHVKQKYPVAGQNTLAGIAGVASGVIGETCHCEYEYYRSLAAEAAQQEHTP